MALHLFYSVLILFQRKYKNTTLNLLFLQFNFMIRYLILFQNFFFPLPAA